METIVKPKAYHTLSVWPKKHRKTLDDIPAEKLTLWAMRLYSLTALSWSYIDTVCDVCALHKIGGETKKLSRQIKTLKLEYDRFHRESFTAVQEEEEIYRAYAFEDTFAKDFRRLNAAISDTLSTLNLSEAEAERYFALQQALTLIEAVKIYARWCDRQILSYDVWTCDYAMVQTEFLKASSLVPQFGNQALTQVNRHPFAQTLASRLHIFGRIYHSA